MIAFLNKWYIDNIASRSILKRHALDGGLNVWHLLASENKSDIELRKQAYIVG